MESMERMENRRSYTPSVDIADKTENFVIKADMPGATKDDIEINLEGDVLSIRGRVEYPDITDVPLLFSEYSVGDYEISFRVSNSIDRDKIEAEMKNGVLTVTLPKAEKEKPKQIKVA